MPRTTADRICAGIYEAATLNRTRWRCLAGIIVGVIASRPVKLNGIASKTPGKGDFTAKYRGLQMFSRKDTCNHAVLAGRVVSVLSACPDGKLTIAIDRTTWKRRGNTMNLPVLRVCFGDIAIPLRVGYFAAGYRRMRIADEPFCKKTYSMVKFKVHIENRLVLATINWRQKFPRAAPGAW